MSYTDSDIRLIPDCPWYSRWWHQRQRNAALSALARFILDQREAGAPDDETMAVVKEARVTQPFFQCPCSAQHRAGTSERVPAVQRQGRTR